MSNAESTYTNALGLELKLFLDIDLKSETILDFTYKGQLASVYAGELEELKSKILNLSYEHALNLKSESIDLVVLLSNGKRPLAALSLWLVHKAIEDYLGTSAKLLLAQDLLCLCFGISKSDIQKEVLARNDYELKNVIAETMATSGCGSCREKIIKTMQETREEHGLILGLTHSQSRLDKQGQWIKIKDMYPGDLLIKLDELKKNWMLREGISNQFQIEIKNIEGHHVWLAVTPALDTLRNEKVILALSDFWRSEIGALFFLHLVS